MPFETPFYPPANSNFIKHLDRDYVNLVSPIATCNILENNRDIYGSLSILQDSIYTSVVTIRLANIEAGQYALVVHEDPIHENDCGSAHNRFHFGRDQFEITSQFSVSPNEDRKQLLCILHPFSHFAIRLVLMNLNYSGY